MMGRSGSICGKNKVDAGHSRGMWDARKKGLGMSDHREVGELQRLPWDSLADGFSCCTGPAVTHLVGTPSSY